MNSTGPITPQGKAVSRMNALKTGIHASGEVVLPTEKIENLQLLTEEYYDHYAPTDTVQRSLVDTLINSEWLLRRFRRIEADILNRACFYTTDARDKPTCLGWSHAYNDKAFDRLQRRVNSTQRNFAQALKLLRDLQAEAAKASQTKPLTPTGQFVPSAPKPAPEPPAPKPIINAPIPQNPAPPTENRPPNAA